MDEGLEADGMARPLGDHGARGRGPGELKGQLSFGGFLFGILLGPIGWLLTLLFAGPKMGRCSQCKSRIPLNALRCPPCGVDFAAAQPAIAAASMKKCPQCAEMVQADARICRYCRHEFMAPGVTPG
jgi:RNA polymerase subunit RPABC4/transcription elongation factor Spt4